MHLFFEKNSFKQKIKKSLYLIGLLPTIIFGMYFLIQTNLNFQDTQKQIVEKNLIQLQFILEKEMEEAYSSMNRLIFNPEILNNISKEFPSTIEHYKYLRDIYTPTIQNSMAENSKISKIYFLRIDSDLNEHEMSDEYELVDKAIKNKELPWLLEGSYLYMIKEFTDVNSQSFACVIEFDKQEFFQPIQESLADNTNLEIINTTSKEKIYSSDRFPTRYNYLIIDNPISNSPWEVRVYYNNKILKKNRNDSILIFMTILSLTILITYLISRRLEENLELSIKKLKNKIVLFNQNSYYGDFTTTQSDEFGELTNLIGDMVKRIDYLNKKTYQTQIDQKTSEYQALATQIDAHFLYNTLSIINWKAIMNNDQEISDITQTLSRYYRTSLNKGKTESLLVNELENIKAYLKLQDYINPHRIKIIFQIDKSLDNVSVINLMLQPIIENAIEHGFKNKTSNCILKISTKRMNSSFFSISILDNGSGMTEETIYSVFREEKTGYGLRNINKRIKFYFGDAYGLSIHSKINLGTVVVIKLPILMTPLKALPQKIENEK